MVRLAAAGAASLAALLLLAPHTRGHENEAAAWPAFRGRGDNATAAELPTAWSARGRRNVAWNVRLLGYGQSSPVVWGGRVFVTAVDGETKERLLLVSLDLASGQRQWERSFDGTQKVRDGDTVSRGAPTPAVDAERVYALYESGDLFALDHHGGELWRRSIVAEYGEFQGAHGYASSLAQDGDTLLVQVSHRGPSYLLAIDKRTGRNRWRAELPSSTGWCSPLVVHHAGQPLVLVSASGVLLAVNLATGEEVWRVSGLEGNSAASPACDGELVVVASSEPGFTRAYRLGGRGDVSESHLAWTSKATTTYCSPLIHEGRVWLANKTGVATCLDLARGETLWTQRLPGVSWATPLASRSHVYFISKDGVAAVFEPADEPRLVAENEISFTDVVYAAAAPGNCLLVRAGRGLVCIRESENAVPAADAR